MKYNISLDNVNIDVIHLAELIGVCKDSHINSTQEEKLKTSKLRVLNCLQLKHDSVFEFLQFIWRIDCDIDAARQLERHRAGTFLERSLRSCDPLPEIIPAVDGSDLSEIMCYNDALTEYENAIASGESKEEAKRKLPLCTPTSIVWRIDFRALMNLFEQRLTKAAQSQTREVVRLMFSSLCCDEQTKTKNLDWLPLAWCQRVGRNYDQIREMGYSDENV